jgi:hypothetical protein
MDPGLRRDDNYVLSLQVSLVLDPARDPAQK